MDRIQTMIEQMMVFYDKNKRVPLSREYSSKYGLPAISRIQKYFGNTTLYVIKSGLKPNKPGLKKEVITKEELVREIKEFITKFNRQPKSTDISRKNNLHNFISYKEAFGSWKKALIFAGCKPNHRSSISNFKECKCCQKEFTSLPYLKRIYCSHECYLISKRNKTEVKCLTCGKKIYRIGSHIKKYPKSYCSRKCYGLSFQVPRCNILCKKCGKQITRKLTHINKYKNQFCSRKCATCYIRIFSKVAARSKIEEFLFNLIKTDFPILTIEQNIRSLLSCGYEIDIWIPQINLAIELNGPVHYFNIYGNLDITQQHDTTKRDEINQRGYKFIVIDVSQNNYKKTKNLVCEEYLNVIKPMIVDYYLNLVK
jgi:endogenous inhibitor of DNA gyrase (YacG/DUF329 family)